MPQHSFAPRRAIAIVLAALLTVTAPVLLTAQERFDGLVIRVYDMTGIDAGRRAQAIQSASAIIADAGVEADWLDCRRNVVTNLNSCDAYRKPTDLIVRIMHGSLNTPADSSRVLGVSIIETPTRAGALATIFIDRLEPVARRAGADSTSLLARTIAHEVGHLLLKTNEHGASGLMRETWTDDELAQNRPEDWVFAAPERGRLRALRLQTGQSASNGR
jgi:hypothetical protein